MEGTAQQNIEGLADIQADQAPPFKHRWGWWWALLAAVVFAAALLLLSGPALAVSAADTLGGGTWSLRRPAAVVPLFEYELRLREAIVQTRNDLSGTSWIVPMPKSFESILDFTSGYFPGSDDLQESLKDYDLVNLNSDPLVRALDAVLALLPEGGKLQHVVEAEVWYFQRPDLSYQFLSVGLLLWPSSAELENKLGEYYTENRQFDLALKHFHTALKNDEQLAVARNNLGVLLSAGEQLDQAVAHLEAAAELDPGNALVFTNLGNAYLSADQLEKAAQAFQRATDLNPTLSNAWALQGLTALNQGDFEGAKASFQNALKNDPVNALSQQGLGVIALYQELPEKALAYLQAARIIEPADAVTRLYLGNVLESLGRPQEAIVEYEQTLLMSDDPALTGLAETYLDDLQSIYSSNYKDQGLDEYKGGEASENN